MKMEKTAARKFTDLIVWQKAHQFVLAAYKLSSKFPKTETYGLVSQLRRAAVSVPANIAEGFKKTSKAEKAHFLNIAQSSLEECHYYLILAKDLSYGHNENLFNDVDEIGRLLKGYYDKIKER